MEDSSETDLVMDFDNGVDSIEFLIDAFGYTDLDVLRKVEDVVSNDPGIEMRLFDVNAAGMDASNFRFCTDTGIDAE